MFMNAKALALTALLSGLAVLFSIGPVAAETKRELDAHEHGHGEMNVVLSGDTLEIEMHLPGADVVGFEHEEKSESDKAAVNKALELLRQPAMMVTLPAAAKCAATSTKAEREGGEHKTDGAHSGDGHHKHEKHGKHGDEKKAKHSEFHAEYSFKCAAPKALAGFDVMAFDHFKGCKEIAVQIVGPEKQGKQVLSPNNRRVTFK